MTREPETGLKCESNCEDVAFDMDAPPLDPSRPADDVPSDPAVDILCCSSPDERRPGSDRVDNEDNNPDETERSSSFDGTSSDDDSRGRSSDADADSELNEGLHRFFRKKKLTTHWRKFIRPLMWRCKWLELQMRELHSQASKYDKELLEYDLKKQNNIERVAIERSAARLMPHTTQNHRRQVMKRRKRKRSEDMIDVTTYMTRHNLFSFYENGRLEADGLSVDDDFGDQADRTANCSDDIGDNQDSLVPEFRENDSSLEQILLWIDALQSRVHKLKIQLDKAVFRNSVKRSSTENLHLLTTGDLPASSAQSPTSSHVNVDTMPVGSMYTPQQHSLADVDMEELVLPGSAVSSYEEVNSPSHMIDNSMDPLSIDEISLDDPHFRELYDGLVEDVLINNEADEEDLQDFKNLSHPHLKKVKQEVLDLKEGEGEVKHEIEEATAIAAPVLKRCLDAEFGNLGCESSGRDAVKTEESQVIDDR